MNSNLSEIYFCRVIKPSRSQGVGAKMAGDRSGVAQSKNLHTMQTGAFLDRLRGGNKSIQKPKHKSAEGSREVCARAPRRRGTGGSSLCLPWPRSELSVSRCASACPGKGSRARLRAQSLCWRKHVTGGNCFWPG